MIKLHYSREERVVAVRVSFGVLKSNQVGARVPHLVATYYSTHYSTYSFGSVISKTELLTTFKFT